MNIKKSLILSHIAVCIFPVLMTFFVMLSCFTGLYLYAKSGNHIMAESSFQFNVASQVIKTCLFHGLNHGESIGKFQWVIEMIDPMQTYVILYQDGRPLYQYGNENIGRDVRKLKQRVEGNLESQMKDHTYSMTYEGKYQFVTTHPIHGKSYALYVLADRPAMGYSDAAFEKAFRNINRFIGISLVIFIVLTSYLLSRFLMNRILNPLEELQRGAESIREGNLDVKLHYARHDEFTPSMDAFNLMCRKLKQSLAQREADEEHRKELIASISHDIRTPLTSIKAYVEGLLDHVANTPEKQEKYLQVIQRKADVLERLIDQLLLLTKMDVGEKVLPMGMMNASAMIDGFIEDGQVNGEKMGAVFEFHIEKGIKLWGNSLLLSRIIENLVSNSIKYKVTPKVHITVDFYRNGHGVVLKVCDDGPGVPEKELGRLLEPFYRTDKARSQTDNGSGLGLAIVHQAAGLMHGTVEIKNCTPHGLEVMILWKGKNND